MGVQWTKEQRQVIDLRDRNILVSAAAGSGKTAVLVERILALVSDKDRKIDVDRLLIMTFTKAAAGEMRTRLMGALEARVEEEPENEHLKRQTSLIHNAQITTIHGFCGYVIQNYFHMLELDPGYRVADAGECRLLMGDVAKDVLDAAYDEKNEAFHQFVESYSTGKSDEGLPELVLQLYEFAVSYPWPRECLQSWEEAYELESVEELRQAPWMQVLWEQTGKYLEEAREIALKNLRLALGPGGPGGYEKALQEDIRFLDSLMDIRDYNQLHQALEKPGWARLSPIKDKDVSEAVKERIQDGRSQMKDLLKKLGETFFPVTEEEILQTMADCRDSIHVLTQLVLAFMEAYSRKKREKNLLDFSDMEHFALDILLERQEDGRIQRSQAAKELSLRFEAVMVDEYQDSNLVQEYLMNAVSGWAKEQENLFMVGDVKQSIYRFRLARPELFMEKFKRYTLTPSKEQRVDLHKNFRSRPQVLDSVNYIFRQIMQEELGGVCYDEAAALYPGADFPPKEEEGFANTEVLLVETDSPGGEELKGSLGERELEALAIGERMKKMVGRELVLDKKTGEYRPVRYGDMVILLRTMEGWADSFAKVLEGQGIPAYTASKTGYFSAMEVVTVLNLLRICDNPRQEIPYGAILHSPIVDCSPQELALVRIAAPELPVYQAVPHYVEEGADEELKKKLSSFLDLLEELRNLVPYTPIHQFLLYLYRRTGYKDYVSALPGGAQRQGNLDMLVEKAMDYEKTSFRGLFHFVRYIDSLQSYKVDFGEASLAGGTDSVEIMSIHKSKGLEFPIVFVAGMGKSFNTSDQRNALVLHPRLGIGADAIYPKLRARIPTLLKQMIKTQTKNESLGEELRVLYVALTRAKEKLILTGTVKHLERELRGMIGMLEREQESLSYVMLESAKTYWDWILPAIYRHRGFGWVLKEYGMVPNPSNPLYAKGPDLTAEVVRIQDLLTAQMERQLSGTMARERLLHWEDTDVREELQKEITHRFSFRYPYEEWKEIPVKVSVSELKHQQMETTAEAYEYYPQEELAPLLPRFLQEKEEVYAGAYRGTAYHRVMECLDYGCVKTLEEIQEQMHRLTEKNRLEQAQAACVKPKDIFQFCTSALGKRMAAAAREGRLYRERPFVISRPADELKSCWPSGEKVLVQGIIDAYFVEEDEIVLVDYKTDKVFYGGEKKLTDLYQVQLISYSEALERLTGKRVKEIYMYSFALGREIGVSRDR